MKTLKFFPHLIPLILSGEKIVTWRLFDDKNLQVGDEIQFVSSETEEPFARAELIGVTEKTFRELSDDDKEEHEETGGEKEMIQTYSHYYNIDVTIDTPLKIIKFQTLQLNRF